ncbi:hypothetical protein C0J52_04351 [Blattella germanica]|nr:hypothetical protein C0J52_04351 [Blattella germanica]
MLSWEEETFQCLKTREGNEWKGKKEFNLGLIKKQLRNQVAIILIRFVQGRQEEAGVGSLPLPVNQKHKIRSPERMVSLFVAQQKEMNQSSAELPLILSLITIIGSENGQSIAITTTDYVEKYEIYRMSTYILGVEEFINKNSKVFAASSLWCTYSKLTILRVREKVDVSSFTNVVSFLKKMSVRHVPRKSNVLSRSQIDEFLLNAPDDVFLLIKVVTAFGVFGAYRRQELHDLCFNDVKVEGSVLVILNIGADTGPNPCFIARLKGSRGIAADARPLCSISSFGMSNNITLHGTNVAHHRCSQTFGLK